MLRISELELQESDSIDRYAHLSGDDKSDDSKLSITVKLDKSTNQLQILKQIHDKAAASTLKKILLSTVFADKCSSVFFISIMVSIPILLGLSISYGVLAKDTEQDFKDSCRVVGDCYDDCYSVCEMNATITQNMTSSCHSTANTACYSTTAIFTGVFDISIILALCIAAACKERDVSKLSISDIISKDEADFLKKNGFDVGLSVPAARDTLERVMDYPNVAHKLKPVLWQLVADYLPPKDDEEIKNDIRFIKSLSR